MGRKDTRTLRNIHIICRVQKIDAEVLYNRSKFILSIYRDICWSVMGKAERIHNGIRSIFDSDLDSALIYQESFVINGVRKHFEEKIRSLFESRWMLELVDNVMIQIREYPCRKELCFEILSKCYLSRFQYREAEMLECMNLECSTYYDRKKEEVFLFGLSLWGNEIIMIKQLQRVDSKKECTLSSTPKRYNPDSFTTESPTSLMIK